MAPNEEPTQEHRTHTNEQIRYAEWGGAKGEEMREFNLVSLLANQCALTLVFISWDWE